MSGSKYKTIIPDIEFWKGMIPCQAACPVHTDAGRYVQLIARGKYEDAYLTARSPNPLASVCGRVCAAPCEDKYRRGRIDEPITIRALKRFVTERFGVESMEPDTQDELRAGANDAGNKERWHLPLLQGSRKDVARAQRVAVIGAGPAGLAAAHDLALMGYRVTIFEATDQAGGMMYHGIPEFRLARAVIDKEIEKITHLGVEIRYNTPLTAEFGWQELKAEGYVAVFLSVGVQKGRDLKIEGAELDGVIKAVDDLININNGYRVNLGKKVLVIGSGFVAFDAARTALRAGMEATNGNSVDGETAVESVHTALDVARTGSAQARLRYTSPVSNRSPRCPCCARRRGRRSLKNPSAPETVIGIEATRARFRPNRYGIFHLSGNVVEWTQTINRPFNRERPYVDDDGRNRADWTEARWHAADHGTALASRCSPTLTATRFNPKSGITILASGSSSELCLNQESKDTLRVRIFAAGAEMIPIVQTSHLNIVAEFGFAG